MSIPYTKVSIANLTATTLDERAITSFDDECGLAIFMKANFDQCRDEILRAHPWAFAKEYAQLPVTGNTPLFRWEYEYDLPADCVRVLPITADGDWNGEPIAFERKGRKILTNESAPINLVYIKRELDFNVWDPDARRVLAEYMAVLAAQRVTGKSSYLEKAMAFYTAALQTARLNDALDSGTPEDQYRENIHNVRLAG